MIKTKVTRVASKTQTSTRVQGRDDQISVDVNVNVNVGDKVFVNVGISASEKEVRFLSMVYVFLAAEFFDGIIRLLPYNG